MTLSPWLFSEIYRESAELERHRHDYYETWRSNDMEAALPNHTKPTKHVKRLLPIEDYHRHPALGSSTLKSLDRDGAAMTCLRISGAIEEAQSRALVVGSALHTAVESADKLHSWYVAAPNQRGYGTGDSAAFQELQERTDKTLLTSSEMETVVVQAAAIRNKLASYPLGCTVLSEPSLFVDAPALGVELKCRPDLLVFRQSGDIEYLEIKTAADISPRGFRSAVWRYGYWLQQAHYERVIGMVYGRHVRTKFVVVSKTRPAVVRVYRIDDLSSAAAAKRWEELVLEYRERKGTLDWEDESVREPTTLELGMGHTEETEYDLEEIE